MTRAAVCRAHGSPLSVEDVEVAAPGAAQVRVDVRAVAVCHSDIIYAAGGWGGETPAIYGHEAAGVVESVGPGVTSVAPGQPVVLGLLRTCGSCFHCTRGEDNLCVGDFDDASPFKDAAGGSIVRGLKTGAFAEQTVVHESQVVAIPGDVPLTSACLLSCGVLTGFGSVRNTAAMPPGSTAAVIGVGGVGLGAVLGAVHAGAERIVGVDLVASKLDASRSFGVTDTVDASAGDAVAMAHAATDGIGPDFVFVTVGAKSAIQQGLAMARKGGTVVIVGMPASGVMIEFEAVEFSDASQRILGSKMGSSRMATDVPALIDLYRRGTLDLDAMVTNTLPLDDINAAVDQVNTGAVIRNVIVMDSR